MNIPSLEFYVESIRHLTSSVAIRRQIINNEESYKKSLEEYIEVLVQRLNDCESEGDARERILIDIGYAKKDRKANKNLLEILRAKQKHEKRMLAYFVAQQRDILDYYKATEELYEGTL